MRNIVLLAINTLRVIMKKKSSIIIYPALPIVGVVFALLFNMGNWNRPVRVGIIDDDGGRFAREMVSRITKWGSFNVRAVAREELDGLIASGALDCGLIIPAGYDVGLLQGSVKAIRLVSIKGEAVTAWLERFINLYSRNLSDAAAASGGDARRFEEMVVKIQNGGARLTVEKLPDLSTGKRVTLQSLGFLLMFLMLGASMTTQLVLAEKRSRTYYRICGAPVLPRQFIVGNGSAAIAIIAAQIVAIQLLMKYVFRIETYVPDLTLFVILFLFGLASVGLGMLVAAFSSSSGMAVALSTLILTPTCMLGGCFWPVSIMPAFMQRLAFFVPQRWVIDAVSKAQTGGGIGTVVVDLVVIAAFALAFMSLAGYRFARSEESGQYV